MNYLGIDPGKSGGLALLTNCGDADSSVYHAPMPATDADLWNLLRDWLGLNAERTQALIEKVHSSPQMGVRSAFTFGRGYGTLRGLLTAACVPFDEVSPQRWQKSLGCLSRGDKNVTKAKAQQLFPGLRITHATADALLIAEFCRRGER